MGGNSRPYANLRTKVSEKQTSDLPSNYRPYSDLTQKAEKVDKEIFTNDRTYVPIDRGNNKLSETEIVERGLKYFRENKKLPTISNLGINSTDFYEVYDSLEYFHTVLGNYIWENNECIHLGLHKDRLKSPKKTNKYMVTSIASDAIIHEKAYKTGKAYCKKFDTEFALLPAVEGKLDILFDAKLKNDPFILDQFEFHENLVGLPIRLSNKTQNPTSGLERLGSREVSLITNSTKQTLKSVAIHPSQPPHFLWTPGCISLPNYQKNVLFANKAEKLAEQDHTLGALIIEIRDGTYFIRDIQFNEDGSFSDMGYKYYLKNDKLEKKPIGCSVVLGDLQTGQHSKVIMDASKRLCKQLKPKEVIVHDGFDGYSVSHWENSKPLMKHQMYKEGKGDLQQEINKYAEELKSWLTVSEKIYLVKSNHDEFLNRWLNEGTYAKDVVNMSIGNELANILMQEKDPLEYALRKAGLTSSNVIFGKRDDTHKIAGIEVGQHGDKGSNGARASSRSFGIGYDKSVKGHSHTPEITPSVRTVGNMIGQVTHYGKGCTSSWAPANNVIYDDGTQQMIIITRNGKF